MIVTKCKTASRWLYVHVYISASLNADIVVNNYNVLYTFLYVKAYFRVRSFKVAVAPGHDDVFEYTLVNWRAVVATLSPDTLL